MCGIAGILTSQNTLDITQLQRMTDAIAHRGPDGFGHWLSTDQKVALGHRRLSIIDLTEGGKQPMHYADGRYSITFNGEIYNYLELKEQLAGKGYTFQSESDTEVLLALFHEKKEKCLQDLDGMFAFAIWDSQEKTLFCARDRFGEKPFYYEHQAGKSFTFASEMKALFAGGVGKEINWSMWTIFLQNNYALTNTAKPFETFYQNVHKLLPAHYLIVKPNLEIEIKSYWQLAYQNIDDQITESQAVEKFRELFYTSVRRRLRADVPVGSSLSGGLDSSLVVCTINDLNKAQTVKQNTFSARFPGFAKDEGQFMQYVIDATNVEPHFTFPDEEGFLKSFEQLCYHQEEPFGSASIFAQWEVMRLAKEKNVTVLLDGQGADEILAGYHFYYDTFFKELFNTNVTLYEAETKIYKDRYPYADFKDYQAQKMLQSTLPTQKQAGIVQSLKNILKQTPFYTAYQKIKGTQTPDYQLFTNDFLHQTPLEKINFDPKKLSDALHYSTCVHGLQDLLRYADRNSMAHSREVRLPFLFHELVEFLFTLPNHFKIHEGWTKYIQRVSFPDILPKEIAWRTDKIGYEPPQASWLKHQSVKEKIEAGKEKLLKAKIINPKYAYFDNITWIMLMTEAYFD